MTNPNREAQIEAVAKALFERAEDREQESYPNTRMRVWEEMPRDAKAVLIYLDDARTALDVVTEVLGDTDCEQQLLREIVREYAQHQSWRCDDQTSWAWEPKCHCGLTQSLREVGLPIDWVAVSNAEAT